jgi:hypothetical protein
MREAFRYINLTTGLAKKNDLELIPFVESHPSCPPIVRRDTQQHGKIGRPTVPQCQTCRRLRGCGRDEGPCQSLEILRDPRTALAGSLVIAGGACLGFPKGTGGALSRTKGFLGGLESGPGAKLDTRVISYARIGDANLASGKRSNNC